MKSKKILKINDKEKIKKERRKKIGKLVSGMHTIPLSHSPTAIALNRF